MQQPSSPAWPVNDRFLELRSHWMTLIGEHLQDDRGQLLEYWRVEKADSSARSKLDDTAARSQLSPWTGTNNP